MSAIKYRSYLPGDEQQIVHLWNRSLAKDPITPLRFRKLVLLDPNFDPQGMRLAVCDDQIVGCLYVVRRKLPMIGTELETDRGWIPFFFVDPQYRRRGIASQLLTDAVTFLRNHGRKKVFFSAYAPNYIVPGIDRDMYPKGSAFLDHAGFEVQYTSVAMDYSLVGFEIPEDVVLLKEERIREGYSFSLVQNLNMSQILIARHHEKLVGFCLFGGYEGIRERFGPFGVDPDERGKGIGKILLYDCLKLMQSHGLHGAWFLWTGEESPAGHLYKKAGFHITRSFDIVCKQI